MSSLDENRLKTLIENLQLAQKMGFSSSSSPIEYLLEAAIDLNLQIGSLLSEGTAGQILNQDLKFLDLEKPDALGNSKSIKIGPKKSLGYFAPQIGKFLSKYQTSFFVLIKQKKYVEAFHELTRGLQSLNSDLGFLKLEEQKQKKSSPPTPLKASPKKPSKVWKTKEYFRRRQRK
jgi:hypothetical protein